MITRRALPVALALSAAIGGAFVAWHYHRLGLTLSHYDARGHLVVARRIVDNITPGWQQIGAVWLPLPHLLNALPVQVDLFYRTGASAVAISIVSFAIACGSIAWIVIALTESWAAAIAGVAVFALNPNVLYLQATPMTEPLLLALTTLSIAMLMSGANARATGIAFALACLTRYEAWPVTASALTAAVWVRWRGGNAWRESIRAVAEIALYPVTAIVGFTIFSRVVIGQWFVSSDFFVPENKSLGDPMLALKEIAWGTQTLSGSLLVWIAAAGLAVLLLRAALRRRDARAILPLALVTMAAIASVAFYKGHPFRIRYMVPLIAVEGIGAGALASTGFGVAGSGFLNPKNPKPGTRNPLLLIAAAAVLALAGYELRPLDVSAPMVAEAQWDRPNHPVRAQVTACLGAPGRGEKIMASMGSLGHYMQETSASGFAISDFLHEGNGDIWLAAIGGGPLKFAEWVLIEEKAQGGDVLAKIARARPSFLDGYTRVCEGAGLALYRRVGGTGQKASGVRIETPP